MHAAGFICSLGLAGCEKGMVMKMKEILCFGDSNTYGLIPGTKDRYDWKTRWTGIVGEKMKEKGYVLSEEGLCGRTTIFDDPLRAGRRGTELLPVLLETHKPDIVVIMLGTNDCKIHYDASPELIGLGAKKLVEQVQSNRADAKIVLVSPIALGDGVGEEGYDPEFDENSVERSKRLPKVFANVAKEKQIAFLAASDFALPSKADREHMDETGHAQFAEAVIEKLSQLIV